MNVVDQQQFSEDAPAPPGFGLKRPTFGLSRERVNRLELVLAMRGGGVINVYEELGNEITAELLTEYSKDLAQQIGKGTARSFADSWSATGQHSWINLGEVTAFTVRQAK